MSTDSFDVIVVGGGPAGSTCARQLARAGQRVAVIDKAEFPRDKVCAGWVTPAVVELLDIDQRDYRRDRVLQPISGFRTSCEFRSPIDTGYPSVVSYGIRRFEFDHYLLSRCGAEIITSQPVKGIERQAGAWVINGRYSAPLLIGAGGHACPVSRHLGNPLGTGVVAVAAQEMEVAMTPAQSSQCRIDPQRPELVFSEQLNGYGWVFRKGDWLNIGFGCEEHGNIRARMQEFYQELLRLDKLPADLPANFKGHTYLLYRHATRNILGDGVLLIGDAAGLAYTQSGEGIRPAVESAFLAAATVMRAKGGQAGLGAYARMLGSRFGKRDVRPPGAGPVVRLRQALGKTLLAQPWFARRVLLDRWFLHRRTPPLQPR